METLYSRSDNIDETIRSVKLPYVAWKVLFLVTENSTAEEIKDVMQGEADEVAAALRLLEENGLVNKIINRDEGVQTEKAETAPAEETTPQAVVEEIPEESAAPAENEDAITEETLIEEIDTEETITPQVSADEPIITETAEEEVESMPVDESDENASVEAVAEEETSENIIIDVPTDDTPDLTEDLDFDVDIVSETEETPVETVPPAEPVKAEGDFKKILVIDDSLVIRKMVEIALEDEEYEIETAVSGKEGLSKLDTMDPALVILDMMLPDINGIEILKTIKASKGIPVIMLSGKDSPQMIENAKKEGAEEFLPKPFKDDDLVEKVKALTK